MVRDEVRECAPLPVPVTAEPFLHVFWQKRMAQSDRRRHAGLGHGWLHCLASSGRKSWTDWCVIKDAHVRALDDAPIAVLDSEQARVVDA